MRGYQADIDGQNRNANGVRYTGQNYEERGRTFLALRGQVTHIGKARNPHYRLARRYQRSWKALSRTTTGMSIILIVRGNVLIHILNGHVMSVVVDDDPKGRRFDGLSASRSTSVRR